MIWPIWFQTVQMYLELSAQCIQITKLLYELLPFNLDFFVPLKPCSVRLWGFRWYPNGKRRHHWPLHSGVITRNMMIVTPLLCRSSQSRCKVMALTGQDLNISLYSVSLQTMISLSSLHLLQHSSHSSSAHHSISFVILSGAKSKSAHSICTTNNVKPGFICNRKNLWFLFLPSKGFEMIKI